MSSKHTPGPWTIKATHSSIEVRPAKGAPICEIVTHDSAGAVADPAQDRANAVLIAAAPDLLEALKTRLDYTIHAEGDTLEDCKSRMDTIASITRAAIAKAEG